MKPFLSSSCYLSTMSVNTVKKNRTGYVTNWLNTVWRKSLKDEWIDALRKRHDEENARMKAILVILTEEIIEEINYRVKERGHSRLMISVIPSTNVLERNSLNENRRFSMKDNQSYNDLFVKWIELNMKFVVKQLRSATHLPTGSIIGYSGRKSSKTENFIDVDYVYFDININF